MKNDHILRPIDLLLSVISGALLTVALNLSLVVGFLLRNEKEAFIELYQDAVTRGQTVFYFFEDNKGIIATLSTVLLWALVFIVGYSILYFIFKETKSVKDEFKIHIAYIHPKNVNKASFWGSSLLIIVYPIIVVTLAVLWTITSFSVLLPFSSTSLIIALHGGNSIYEAVMVVLLAVGVTSLMVIGYTVIFKLLKTISKFLVS